MDLMDARFGMVETPKLSKVVLKGKSLDTLPEVVPPSTTTTPAESETIKKPKKAKSERDVSKEKKSRDRATTLTDPKKSERKKDKKERKTTKEDKSETLEVEKKQKSHIVIDQVEELELLK